jgi:amidase
MRLTKCDAPDDPEIYDGAPVGLQIVARKYEEEKVLAITKTIYAALQKEKESGKFAH